MKKTPDIWITLVLAMFMTVALSFVFPKNDEKYLGDLFWTKKTFAPSDYNIVIMGDSRTYRGISPDIMQEFLPDMKILNFAYSNGGLNHTMFNAAEEKLVDGNNPKIIVLGISPNTVTGFSSKNDQYFQELGRSREEILERLYLYPILYWFSPTSLEELVNKIKEKKEVFYYRNTFHMNGYMESEKYPVDTLEAIPYYEDDFAQYKVEEENINDLLQQVKTWNNQGIKVLAFRPPVSVPMKMLEDSVGKYDEYRIKKGIEESGGYWIDLAQGNYKTYDGSHLDVESAEKLSVKIAEKIEALAKQDSY